MLGLLHGNAERMRIEEPRVDERSSTWRGRTGNIGRQSVSVWSQKTWSLATLASEGVLRFFLEQARRGNCCVFASITDAPELRTLAERARDSHAGGLAEFQDAFLAEKTWRGAFAELRRSWDNCSEAEAFECLKRVEVRVADDVTLTQSLCDVLGVLFNAPGATTLDCLRALYDDSVHQVLNADSVREHLRTRNIYPRVVTIESSVLTQVSSITETYVVGQRLKLIRGELISRTVAQSTIAAIASATRGQDFLIMGGAGSGKSGCLFETVTGLVTRDIPVLAFRLDRVRPVQTPAAIGAELGLTESPAVVLARAFPMRKVVLVIDQLDFVSTTSGRHPDFFDAVAALIGEVRGLRAETEIHLVLTCRQFDFEHDARLRALLPKNESPQKLEELSEGEVRAVLTAEGSTATAITQQQLKLLLLPQNLALFVDAGLAQQDRPSFVSQKELFDAYWHAKYVALSADCGEQAAEWKPILETLSRAMNDAQELSVPKARLDAFSPRFFVGNGLSWSSDFRWQAVRFWARELL